LGHYQIDGSALFGIQIWDTDYSFIIWRDFVAFRVISCGLVDRVFLSRDDPRIHTN